MKKIQIINGPNLNLLGRREPGRYGARSFEDYLEELRQQYPDVQLSYYQSNHEGDLIDCIHSCGFEVDGIVLNEVNASRVFLSFNDNETTAIKNVNYETGSSYYSLSGQQVKKPAKGIYVKDGKKVIIK